MTVAAHPESVVATRPRTDPVLRVGQLRVEFATRDGAIAAVRGIDLEVASGETVVIVGESGSGKSVTARTIMGLAGPTARVSADELWLDGVDLLSAPATTSAGCAATASAWCSKTHYRR